MNLVKLRLEAISLRGEVHEAEGKGFRAHLDFGIYPKHAIPFLIWSFKLVFVLFVRPRKFVQITFVLQRGLTL